jgi:hypothetical protein
MTDVTGSTITTVASVKPERVRWLWPRRIPFGKLSLLDGDPDKGKSTITLDLAARVTTGSPMPDGDVTLDEPAGVLVLSAEDGVADTIRPRLESAGADLERVHVLEAVWYLDENGETDEREVTLPTDVRVIERAIVERGVALLIIDPLAAYLAERVDSYKDHDVRRALRPLAALAMRTGVAMIVVRHFNKTGGNALYRGGGSIGIIGAARAALLVADDPDDESRRILAVSKCNLAAKPPALAYRLVPDDLHDCASIAWEGPTRYRADELLVDPIKVDIEHSGALDAACTFLDDVLGPGDQWVKTVKDEAKAAGVAWRTVERAKAMKHVLSVKVGGKRDPEQGWKWHLPTKAAKNTGGRQEAFDESAGQDQPRQPRLMGTGLDGLT